MSWSTSTGPIDKNTADAAIDALEVTYPIDGPSREQLNAAKRAAKELVKSVPGPLVSIGLYGHANGSGWKAAGDSVNVSISQSLPAPEPVAAAPDAQA